MAPILGIWASQISGRLWEPAGAYDALATVTVPSGGAATVTFAGIPTGYKHLQIRCITHSSGGTQPAMLLTFNNETSNYYWHGLEGSGSGSAYAYAAGTNNSAIWISSVAGTSYAASTFSGHVIDVLDYANTAKFKTTRALGGEDGNGLGYISFNSGLWQSTNAVTSMSFAIVGGSNFTQYSQFALYGVK